MRLHEQVITHKEANIEAQDALTALIDFLANSDKFKGQGDDWVRTGEVWPILRDIRKNLAIVLE